MTRSGGALSITAAIAAVVLSACGGGGDSTSVDQGSSRTVSAASQAPTTTAPPIDPCAQVAGTCAHVADADVDGDGVDDQIGVSFIKVPPESDNVVVSGKDEAVVSVGINGRQYKIEVPVTGLGYDAPAEIYRGAYVMSRAAGADIVLHLVRGQGNAEQFAVISWDGTALVALPQPPTADQTGTRLPGIWYLGSSHGRIDYIVCKQPGEVAVTRLTAATAEGMPVPGGGRREENLYLFSGDSWQPSGSANVADGSFSYNWDAHTKAFECRDQGRAPD